jgi:hypothetical protein
MILGKNRPAIPAKSVFRDVFLTCQVLSFYSVEFFGSICVIRFCTVSNLALFDHNRGNWTPDVADSRPNTYLFKTLGFFEQEVSTWQNSIQS